MLNGQKTAELNNGLFAEGPFTLQHGEGVIKFRKSRSSPCKGGASRQQSPY
jgi:hypothetical protein